MDKKPVKLIAFWVCFGIGLALGYTNCAEIGDLDSETFEARIVLEEGLITINNNANYTKTTDVILSLKNDEADEVYVTNIAQCGSGGEWQPLKPTMNWTLPVTDQNVSVYAKFRKKDSHGESPCTSDSIVHDDVAPIIMISEKPPAISRNKKVAFVFSAGDNTSGIKGFQCSLNDQTSYKACSSPYSLTLNDGNYTFYIMTFDNAGNIQKFSHAFKVDTSTPKAVTITGKPPGQTKQVNATFSFTKTTDITRTQCKINESLFTNCTSPVSYGALKDGINSFSVRGYNKAGNVSPTASFTWQIDNGKPTLSFIKTPKEADQSAQFTFEFSAIDKVTGVKQVLCKLDKEAFTNCTTLKSHDLKNLSYGSHTFLVKAIDNVGNVSNVISKSWQRVALNYTLASPRNLQVIQRNNNNVGQIPIISALPTATKKVVITLFDSQNKVVSTKGINREDLKIINNTFTQNYSALGRNEWYKLQVELIDNKGVRTHMATVPKVGVGEVFLTAGQSNSVSSGEKPLPNNALSSFAYYNESGKITWKKDIDNYPDRGSAWAPFVNYMTEKLKVPIAISMVGCGGTHVKQWLPPVLKPDEAAKCGNTPQKIGGLYLRLLDASLELKNFRAILWHQGESDTTRDYRHLYASMMESIIKNLNTQTKRKIPWFVANVSYVPGADVDKTKNCAKTGKPNQRQSRMVQVRRAQQSLWNKKIALKGVDSDPWWGPVYRKHSDCIHFNARGQVVLGEGWAKSVLKEFESSDWGKVH